MLALILTAAIGTSPEPDCIVFDCLEHNAYGLSRFTYYEECPQQTILWRDSHVVHWEGHRVALMRDGDGCYGFIGGQMVRGLRYRDTWSWDDPEVEDRWLHGGNGFTTHYRKTPSEW